MNSDRENTIRIRGRLGRRAHAVALQMAEALRTNALVEVQGRSYRVVAELLDA